MEDGVDILLVDNSSTGDDKDVLDDMHRPSDILNISDTQNDSNGMQSFTFEAQVTCYGLFSFTILLLCGSVGALIYYNNIVYFVHCHINFCFLAALHIYKYDILGARTASLFPCCFLSHVKY